MTLVLQIAGGIVLAVLVLRFWRQALWLSLVVLGLAVIGVGLLLANGRGYLNWNALAGVIGIAIVLPALKRIPKDHRVKKPDNASPPT